MCKEVVYKITDFCTIHAKCVGGAPFYKNLKTLILAEGGFVKLNELSSNCHLHQAVSPITPK